jgi:2'-5' RNA ligase
MQAIVSLLDDESTQAVRDLWAELERTHGLREAARTVPYPHVSYHLAVDYDLVKISEVMRRVAKRISPFTIRITGLGTFTEFEPVLYLAVERTAELDALHAALWRELAVASDAAHSPSPLYASATWVPHVTLAQRDLSSGTLESLLAAWSTRDFRRNVRISDLTLLYRKLDEAAYTPLEQLKLSGESSVWSI